MTASKLLNLQPSQTNRVLLSWLPFFYVLLSAGFQPSAYAEEDTRLALLRKRTTAGLKEQKEALLKIQTGELDIESDTKEALKKHQATIAELQLLQKGLNSPTLSADDRELLSRKLFTGLQLVGDWLADATHLPSATEWNQDQWAEFDRLYEVDRGPNLPNAKQDHLSKLRVLGPSFYYTLHFLSVPLVVETDPGAIVFWEAPTGGVFEENGITLLQTEADESGIARATWVTKGSAVGPADIIATSPNYRLLARFEVHVVNLLPKIELP